MNSISDSSDLMKCPIKIMVPRLSSTTSFCDHARMLIQNYRNFKRSSEPARIMYYDNGSWVDYPEEVVELLKMGFVGGQPVIEGKIDGYKCLFDFYRMLELELDTGNQRSIAWIDVNGKCFFPMVFVDGNRNNENTLENCDESGVKVEIEIRISENSGNLEGSNSWDLNKCENLNKRKRECLESTEKGKAEGSSSNFNDAKRRQIVGNEIHSARWPGLRVLRADEKGYLIVKNLFLSGMGMLKHSAKITSIHRCVRTSPLDQARHVMFLKQMEITKIARGDSNTIFAWYGTSAKGVESILKHGFGMPGKVPGPQGYGDGIYLSPIRSPDNSAMFTETDENGEKHIILCRVILGKCEKIGAGSRQLHPSSVEYDSGVDDLKNPKWYVVWCDNMNTHILPECVVSYIPIDVSDRENGMSNVNWVSHGSNSLIVELFSKLKSSLSLPKIQEFQTLCGAYKEGKMGKDIFMTKLRSVVGDDVLRSAFSDIRG
ncbi:inactive poly [ADP-ribose] polymerase RCD1-like [Olea europaea var. sylvestris]|uniref:Probable inactive poly [ADP-ribose] polymerase SRO3 n=1 Tax=Olea europaea subsp. europaea TaxID=158383 RepID=A0A8S0PXS0_OLEEU|nr:inactive poly [ADP-ribose] polymerase RCD1-like [Olea europaea var. sylvestris]CAA2959920.1 probable inactive poly [ADP-ribose] polymerase SRO3 [Olea europaea subsp. europaea]